MLSPLELEQAAGLALEGELAVHLFGTTQRAVVPEGYAHPVQVWSTRERPQQALWYADPRHSWILRQGEERVPPLPHWSEELDDAFSLLAVLEARGCSFELRAGPWPRLPGLYAARFVRGFQFSSPRPLPLQAEPMFAERWWFADQPAQAIARAALAVAYAEQLQR